jgi:hypothetical protein
LDFIDRYANFCVVESCNFENLKGSYHSEGLSVGGRILLDWLDLREIGGRVRTGFGWLKKGTGVGLF